MSIVPNYEQSSPTGESVLGPAVRAYRLSDSKTERPDQKDECNHSSLSVNHSLPPLTLPQLDLSWLYVQQQQRDALGFSALGKVFLRLETSIY